MNLKKPTRSAGSVSLLLAGDYTHRAGFATRFRLGVFASQFSFHNEAKTYQQMNFILQSATRRYFSDFVTHLSLNVTFGGRAYQIQKPQKLQAGAAFPPAPAINGGE
jgi:hypothetical protein